MTAAQIEKLLESRLRNAGLSKYVNKELSQFLELPAELFVEVVLDEGSALDDVGKIVHQTAEELKRQGITLDGVVRTLWEIVGVKYVGHSRTADLQWRAAEEFRAELKSGSRHCQVIVDVFWGAIDVLRHKLGLKETWTTLDAVLPDGHVVREMVAPVVMTFLNQQLARGGASYWDPLLLDQRVELSATDMSFLLGQSAAFEELRQAISDAFEPPVLESFLGSLQVSGTKIGDFNAVLPELSNMLGGAYRRGETFSTNAKELFQRLDRTEQELLKKYFEGRVEHLKTDSRFSELLRKFESVLT